MPAAAHRRSASAGGSGSEGSAYEGPNLISSLANDLLRHILFFLPLVEAIRTCVLSRRESVFIL
uniref:F-box domain-containing protein n=1 Tax=Oryza punctata TaxID=4537 RepID=A0A0E0LLX9_ORYPU